MHGIGGDQSSETTARIIVAENNRNAAILSSCGEGELELVMARNAKNHLRR
jgi:hypothetical protein